MSHKFDGFHGRALRVIDILWAGIDRHGARVHALVAVLLPSVRHSC